MPNFPEWKAIFAPKGQLLKLGDKISRPAYGRTLRYLSKHGADAFYTGHLAESSIKTIRKAGGIMTLEDFANYKANVQPAVKGTYHGKSIYTTHLPSGGPVLLHLMNILENYNLKEQGRTPKNIHRFVEALKCEVVHGRYRAAPKLMVLVAVAFARRTSLGDPAFAPQQGERLYQLLDKHFAKEVTRNLTDVSPL
jgi:gamma-glutamyltranspeptidase/glutathione hydrolase/leukotriene-C4 hydrolase